MIDVSIVIVNWNTRSILGDCLTSIRESRDPTSREVIVIDNSSSDGSAEMVKNEFPWCRLLENSRNLGFAAANNRGARLAGGKYLLFLNSDTRLHPQTLAQGMAFMESRTEVGVMGCRTLNGNGSFQPTAFSFPTALRIFSYILGLNRIFKLSRLKRSTIVRYPDFVQGSFLFVRRDVFQSCQGFDECFFMYNEEVDLCLRIRALGWRVCYFPGAVITHFGRASAKKSEKSLGYFIKSTLSLFRKHRSVRQLRRLAVVIRTAIRLRFLAEALRELLGFGLGLKKARKSFRFLMESASLRR